MNQLLAIISFLCVVLVTSAQRAPFAGSRPNGYKDKLQTTNTNNNINTSNNNVGIVDRFGENTNTAGVASSGTTEKLPNLALGDREIVDRLNTFPQDQQLFWFINAQAIENQKNPNGRPSNPTNQNAADIGNRFGSGSGTAVNSNRPSYATVVYPLEMTANQQQQAQQAFNNQIQQAVNTNNNNNNGQLNSNSLSSRIGVQGPVVVAQQSIINDGPKQIPQPVQGRLSSSGYNG